MPPTTVTVIDEKLQSDPWYVVMPLGTESLRSFVQHFVLGIRIVGNHCDTKEDFPALWWETT